MMGREIFRSNNRTLKILAFHLRNAGAILPTNPEAAWAASIP